jgi:hypothetical protein
MIYDEEYIKKISGQSMRAGVESGLQAERDEIAKAIKSLPQHALFYPENILKILKLH